MGGAFTGRSGWLGVAGLLTVVTGIVLIASPGIGAVSLALILGIYLLAYGVTLLVSAATAAGRPNLGPKAHRSSAAA